ncbi:TetR/AcrR family transcriptional regulator [Achromobacter marplatensis]|uniref:TetR/AcrR family transcriptional regulator n=1 Tax=Achromobacter marplatensis TaxID=470868 RepID=A0AA42WAV3_9BURK|nr:TetR/AcrR family transcriptional regulator [Achromobacter marplatensis]MDH2050547.1 TetR/AcrR family transcriptional regulator [Achromobacter marplatensis]
MAGRPREFDRDLALQQAMLAFWKQGYEGTSMADLVAATGLASARLYAAFGSKQELFREAVARYEAGDGAFAEKALEATDGVRGAIEKLLTDAVLTYTRRGRPQGCMVVSAATNYAAENEDVMAWLTTHRKARTQGIIDRLESAVQSGELKPGTDVQALGDYYAVVLHGLSVQARDGVGKARLLAMIPPALGALDAVLCQGPSRP